MPNQGEFHDAALVLVAHGSTVSADAATPALRHAAGLRGRGLFARVEAGFWKQEPTLHRLVGSLMERRVFFVPLMVSDGYFGGQVIPRELGFAEPEGSSSIRVQRRGDSLWCYAPPIGTHPRMADLLLRQARDVVARHPFPRAPLDQETALCLAGHGTLRQAKSRDAIEHQAGRLRALGCFGEVHAVYLEETPRIAEVYELTRLRNLVVVPFFISDGQHAAEDLPVLLGEPENAVRERLVRGQSPWRNPTERRGKRVWYAAGIGNDPAVAEIVLERAREAAAASSRAGEETGSWTRTTSR